MRVRRMRVVQASLLLCLRPQLAQDQGMEAPPTQDPRESSRYIYCRKFNIQSVLQIRDVDTGSEFFKSRIRIKEFKYFNPKNCF
jgi:hypothetical protein